MQALGVLSFLWCVLCMYSIYRNWMPVSNLIFACSLLFLALSIIVSLVEINKSTKAIELVLGDIEELNKENIFKAIFKKRRKLIEDYRFCIFIIFIVANKKPQVNYATKAHKPGLRHYKYNCVNAKPPKYAIIFCRYTY